MISVLHVSDLHFGKPSIPEQVRAIERRIKEARYHVVAVSGDISQRARARELEQGRAFLRAADEVSRTIVVPGNHDVKWWRDPLGLGSTSAQFAAYRAYISADLEPVLRMPGATFVGLNTAHGVKPHTLTWNPRDIGVVGDLRRRQVERARTLFAASPATDVRAIVMHHNPMRGELSRRHGLAHTRRALGAFADLGVDLVMCGHDHQEAVHYVEHTKRGTVISTAGTVSIRSRGHRPSSINEIAIAGDAITVKTRVWSRADGDFVEGPVARFAR